MLEVSFIVVWKIMMFIGMIEIVKVNYWCWRMCMNDFVGN